MNILCRLFGHKSLEDAWSGAEYMKVYLGTVDGIGRQHATLYARCPRCDEMYRAGKIHVPPTEGGDKDAVAIPRPLAMKLRCLLHQELLPCALPECRILDNPEDDIVELRALFDKLLEDGNIPS